MRWEYRSIERPQGQTELIVYDMNDAGEEGWEAFAAVTVGSVFGGKTLVLLKRTVETPS